MLVLSNAAIDGSNIGQPISEHPTFGKIFSKLLLLTITLAEVR